jgi:hypothetical protein
MRCASVGSGLSSPGCSRSLAHRVDVGCRKVVRREDMIMDVTKELAAIRLDALIVQVSQWKGVRSYAIPSQWVQTR